MSVGIIFFVCAAFAQNNTESSQGRYSISVLSVYDYSRTFSHQGGIDLAGHISFNPYIESDVGFEFLGPETVIARPKIPLELGELYLDAAINLRTFNRSGIGTFALASSLGDIVNGRGYQSEAFSRLQPLTQAGWQFRNALGNHDTYFKEVETFRKYWPLTTYTFKVNLPGGQKDLFICVYTHTNFFNTDNTKLSA